MKNKFIVYLIIILASGFSLSSYCQDGIPEDIPLISCRIFPGQYESDEQFSRFLEFLNEYPDAVDEIALMDENFPAPAGLPLEAVESSPHDDQQMHPGSDDGMQWFCPECAKPV
ncbi:MAG: hypothetical protein F7O42_09265 [Opitutae bacterium]|nr:hypothetical protein [Opitutae bacterium]